jgi:hypothetical protein
MRSKADIVESDVPVGRYRITTPQLRCRPAVRVRLGPQHPWPPASHGQALRGALVALQIREDRERCERIEI